MLLRLRASGIYRSRAREADGPQMLVTAKRQGCVSSAAQRAVISSLEARMEVRLR